jgi:hypothetical protein
MDSRLVTLQACAEDYGSADNPKTGYLYGSVIRLATLESGEASSMKEIARREGVNDSYVSRMVNLTTLASDIVVPVERDPLAM